MEDVDSGHGNAALRPADERGGKEHPQRRLPAGRQAHDGGGDGEDLRRQPHHSAKGHRLPHGEGAGGPQAGEGDLCGQAQVLPEYEKAPELQRDVRTDGRAPRGKDAGEPAGQRRREDRPAPGGGSGQQRGVHLQASLRGPGAGADRTELVPPALRFFAGRLL